MSERIPWKLLAVILVIWFAGLVLSGTAWFVAGLGVGYLACIALIAWDDRYNS